MSEENEMKKERKQQLAEGVILIASIGAIIVCCGVVGMLIAGIGTIVAWYGVDGVLIDMKTSLAWLSLYFSIAGIGLIVIGALIAVSGWAD